MGGVEVEHRKDGWYWSSDTGKGGPFDTKAAAESAGVMGFVPQEEAHVPTGPVQAPAEEG